MNLLIIYLWDVIRYFFIGLGVGISFCFFVRRGSSLVLHTPQKAPFSKHDVLAVIFIAYCFALLSQTIFPEIDFGISSQSGKPYLDVYYIRSENSDVNLIPLKTTGEFIMGRLSNVASSDALDVSILNLLGNVTLFMPLGFLMPVLWGKCRCIKQTLLIGVALSVFIETIQYFVGRSSDIDDVILNTLGCVTGYIVHKYISNIQLKSRSRKKQEMQGNLNNRTRQNYIKMVGTK